MTSAGNNRWALDLGRIRRGSARIHSPLNGESVDLTWGVRSVAARLLPISIVECRITGMGRTAHGYGDSLFFNDSLTQAFAEAWERLWFEVLQVPLASEGSPVSSTNGFACGATPAEAAEAARSELIERAIFLAAWNSRAGWSPFEPTGFMGGVFLASLGYLGWETKLFRLSERTLGDVMCALGIRREGGILFDCCYRHPGMSLELARSKVLRSLLRSAVIWTHAPPTYAPLPALGGPSSHQSFYANPAHRAAFDFLAAQKTPTALLEIGGYDEVTSRTLLDIDGFPSVALATNPRWPRLCWGQESISKGGNVWPHPLA